MLKICELNSFTKLDISCILLLSTLNISTFTIKIIGLLNIIEKEIEVLV